MSSGFIVKEMDSASKNDTDEAEKKERQMRMVRKIWVVLIPIFTIVILFDLYSWSQGKGDLVRVFSRLGFIFIGLASLTEDRSKTLTYILLAVGGALALAGLFL